jgi:hypothetical protein
MHVVTAPPIRFQARPAALPVQVGYRRNCGRARHAIGAVESDPNRSCRHAAPNGAKR